MDATGDETKELRQELQVKVDRWERITFRICAAMLAVPLILAILYAFTTLDWKIAGVGGGFLFAANRLTKWTMAKHAVAYRDWVVVRMRELSASSTMRPEQLDEASRFLDFMRPPIENGNSDSKLVEEAEEAIKHLIAK